MSLAIWLHAVAWPCPCGEVPVTSSTLPVGSTRIVQCSQPPAAYFSARQPPGRRQPAHLGEGGDADAQLHRVAGLASPLLLRAQPVVVEQLQGPGGGRLVVAACRRSSPAMVVYGNSSCRIQFLRRSSIGSTAELGGQLVDRSVRCAKVASGRPAPR